MHMEAHNYDITCYLLFYCTKQNQEFDVSHIEVASSFVNYYFCF